MAPPVQRIAGDTTVHGHRTATCHHMVWFPDPSSGGKREGKGLVNYLPQNLNAIGQSLLQIWLA